MKRHDSEEISAKLRLAEDMVRGGSSQKDACKTLGISVMTYHRWRKQESGEREVHSNDVDASGQRQPSGSGSDDRLSQIDALRLENERLRRIVSDLLLEKMKVQEVLDKTRKQRQL